VVAAPSSVGRTSVRRVQETVITVEGRHERRHAAERGTVTLVVGFDGEVREDVVQRTTHAHARLVDQVRALHDPSAGPVVAWAAHRLAVGSDRPWSPDGRQLDLVHEASVQLDATFSDLARLVEWVEQVAVLDGVVVRGIGWTLTDEHHKELADQARTRAVADAVERATTYAHALGLTSVHAVAVAEPGLLGGVDVPARPVSAKTLLRGPADNGGGRLDLEPEEVTVAAVVHARFAAT